MATAVVVLTGLPLAAQEAVTEGASTAARTEDAAPATTTEAPAAAAASTATTDASTNSATLSATDMALSAADPEAAARARLHSPIAPTTPTADMQAVLDKLVALGAPPIGTVSVEAQRAAPTPANAVMAVMQDPGVRHTGLNPRSGL